MTYNEHVYEELDRGLAAFPNISARVGSRAPSFRLQTVDGKFVELDELCAKGDVVLIFGSYSAPPAVRQMQDLELLHRSLDRSEATVVFIYTREIHPDDPRPPAMKSIAAHATYDGKVTTARAFRDDLGLTMVVAVDELDGTIHRAYGSLPFFQVVIHRSGTIVHRAAWVEPSQLSAVLANLHSRATGAAVASPKLTYCESLWFSETSQKNTVSAPS